MKKSLLIITVLSFGLSLYCSGQDSKPVKFASHFEGAYMMGIGDKYNEGGGGSLSAGILVNDKSYFGVSFGVFNSSIVTQAYNLLNHVPSEEAQTSQILLNGRYYFLNGRFSPFINSAFGFNKSLDSNVEFSNFFYEVGLGLNYKVLPKLSVYAIGGYSSYPHSYEYLEYTSKGLVNSSRVREDFKNIPIRFGMTLVPAGW